MISLFLFQVCCLHRFIYWNLSVFTTTNLFYCVPNKYYLVKFQQFGHYTICSHCSYTRFEEWIWLCLYYFNYFYSMSVPLCAFYEDNMKTLLRHIVVVNHVGWLFFTLTLNDSQRVSNFVFFIFLFYIMLSIIFILVYLFITVPHSTEDTYYLN